MTAADLERSNSLHERTSIVPGLLSVVSAFIFLVVFFYFEKQWIVLTLLVFSFAVVLAGWWLGFNALVQSSCKDNAAMLNWVVIAGAVSLVGIYHGSPFVLLLVTTVTVYIIACTGLSLQFGFVGMLNFAGAAILGSGGYTAAVLGAHQVSSLLVIVLAGGIAATATGAILLLPMLRTHGHYSAVVTIAFGLLFTTFLEVSDRLGGPQGLALTPPTIFGWNINTSWFIGRIPMTFYVNYFLVGSAIAIFSVVLVRRIENSWIGVCLDAIRLDEPAAQCFGINVTLWKSFAFCVGNFIVGVAGAFYAQMLGYIAPPNFTLSDSLIMVTIILLGGLGSIWGVIITSIIVIVLPEKLQVIQEYRFLLYAVIVVAVILFQPKGLIPRPLRVFLKGNIHA